MLLRLISRTGPVWAGLLLVAAPAQAMPSASAVPAGSLLTCLPQDGHPGQAGCVLPGAMDVESFVGLVHLPPAPVPVSVPAQAQAQAVPEAAQAGDTPDGEPTGGLVALAGVAAVLSLSLRRAAA